LTTVLAFVMWETTIEAIPASLSRQVVFLQSLPKGLWPIVALFVLSFVLFVMALGPDRVEPWMKRFSRRHRPELATTPERETQERRPAQDAPISPLPEPQPGSSDKPFSLEPVKRRGPPKPNGEFDIYMSIRVTNKGSGQIQGCRGRLVRVQDLISTPDGSEWQDIPHIHPAYLRWSPGDGGGDSADFTTEATLDVAIIESWAEPVCQMLTANESLRSTYQVKYEWAGPILSIQISAQSGGWVEQSFTFDGHTRVFLKAPTEVEPVVRWRTWP